VTVTESKSKEWSEEVQLQKYRGQKCMKDKTKEFEAGNNNEII
jgi:hypothetical protein